jgi:hypothetical protein
MEEKIGVMEKWSGGVMEIKLKGSGISLLHGVVKSSHEVKP